MIWTKNLLQNFPENKMLIVQQLFKRLRDILFK